MLSVERLTLYFGARAIFRDVSLTFTLGERTAIVGPNGAGKTTLLRVIAGLQQYDSGSVNLPKDRTLGYLPQEPNLDFDEQATIVEEVCKARKDIVSMTERLETVQRSIETAVDHTSDAYYSLLNESASLHERLEALGAYTLESQAARILSGLGFTADDLLKHAWQFSGGWQTRIELAKLLLLSPDVLLLDEPTNHLDLQSLVWVENFCKLYKGALIVISHDRKFLNAISTRTVELDGTGRAESYAGNYDYYERTKAEREAQRLSQAANLAARRKEIERFIERFRYKATKARQAQSRIKMLERMERVELSSGRPHVQFTFPSAPQSGRMVFEVENGGMSYDGVRKIFSSCELRIERSDRVAFVGKNGEGKTTMGAILAGKLQLTEGDLKIGHNVTIGYFEQHQAESLDPDKTVYETVETLARAMFFRNESSENFNESRLRSLLGTFLFRGDDVFKKVKVLSGGEKSRLALAKMLLEPVNTLILDEPTNHLDMTSKEVLKQALLSFDGTIIVVSHDRDFLEDLTDRIITFGDGKVKEFMAPLEEYLVSLETSVDKSNVTKESKSQEKTDDKQRKKGQAEQQQRKTRSIKPLQNAISTIEKSIAELESRRDMIITAMSSPDYYADSERVKNDNLELNSISTRLTDLYFDWSAKTEELESIS